MSTIGQRIRKARECVDLTAEDLGRRVGVTKGAVSQWELDATTPRGHRLDRLASELRVSKAWLLLGEGSTGGDLSLVIDDATRGRLAAPVLDSDEVRGRMMSPESTVEDTEVLGRAMRPTPRHVSERAFWLEVQSESMTAPPGAELTIPRGYLTLVEPDRIVEAGDVVVAIAEGEAVVRLYDTEPPGPTLRALNPSYAPIPITSETIIVGPVISTARDL